MSDWDFPQMYQVFITYDPSNTTKTLVAASPEEAAEQYLKQLDMEGDSLYDHFNSEGGEHLTVQGHNASLDLYVKRSYVPMYKAVRND